MCVYMYLEMYIYIWFFILFYIFIFLDNPFVFFYIFFFIFNTQWENINIYFMKFIYILDECNDLRSRINILIVILMWVIDHKYICQLYKTFSLSFFFIYSIFFIFFFIQLKWINCKVRHVYDSMSQSSLMSTFARCAILFYMNNQL